METYSGFYPSRPFWAVSKIDFSARRADGWFTRQMSEIVYEKNEAEFSLKLCRDGQVLLRINRLELLEETDTPHPPEETVACWGEYLDYLNCFYLLLDSALIETERLAYFNIHEITTRDAFRTSFENGKEVSASIAAESIASVFQMGRYLSTYSSSLPIEYDPKLLHRHTVSIDTISLAAERFLAVAKSPGAEKHLASYAKSISEYKVGNYETAIILSWFIIESVVNDLWSSHLETINRDLPGGKRRINRERKDFLTGRDFTASIVTNLLELFDQLEVHTFEMIDKVRGYRNKIVHSDSYSPGAIETNQALDVAKEMIFRKWGVKFTPNLSYSVPGI